MVTRIQRTSACEIFDFDDGEITRGSLLPVTVKSCDTMQYSVVQIEPPPHKPNEAEMKQMKLSMHTKRCFLTFSYLECFNSRHGTYKRSVKRDFIALEHIIPFLVQL